MLPILPDTFVTHHPGCSARQVSIDPEITNEPCLRNNASAIQSLLTLNDIDEEGPDLRYSLRLGCTAKPREVVAHLTNSDESCEVAIGYLYFECLFDRRD